MLSILAATVVTLVVNTADDTVVANDGKLSLREAIAAANTDSRPHIITFKGSGLGYQLLKSALEVRARGALTIDGDANKDGLADVVLYNGYAEKLIIRQGSDVTVIGVDFVYGNGVGHSGTAGASGVDGAQGFSGVAGKVVGDTVTPPTDGNPGGNGTPGKNGTRGESAAGIIHNFGTLHLVRLGLANGYAVAGAGGNGGRGGWGGYGGRGGDGIGSGDEFWVDHDFIIQDGGKGALSGDGARGGDGGLGGSAAGAILNEATGKLTLTDVSFGGRLGGWLVAKGSTAIAARGGYFGLGGDGRQGGTGGEGGDQGYERSILPSFVWVPPGGGSVTSSWQRFTASPIGNGGDGGDGGDRGPDGRFGTAGDAASAVLNLGAMNGVAAIGEQGKVTPAVAQANHPAPYTNGTAGLGGLIGSLRAATFSYCPDIGFYNDPDFTQTALSYAPSDYRLDLPDDEGRLPSPGRSPSTASPGQNAARAPSVAAGKGVLGFLNAGAGKGSVRNAASLVFVYPLGVRSTSTATTLNFNIIRLGKGNQAVTVKWAILKAAQGPSVSPPDFGLAQLPSGSVTFAPLPAGALYDVTNSVKLVSIPVKRDNLTEVPEGYRMTLTSSSTQSVMLGTKLVEGKLVDGSP